MRYKVISVDEADLSIEPDGNGIVSRESQAFVLRRDLGMDEFHRLFVSFIEAFSSEILSIFSMKPKEFKIFNPNRRFIFDDLTCPPNALVGFKRAGSEQSNLNWLRRELVLSAFINTGAIPVSDTRGSKGMVLSPRKGNLTDRIFELETDVQRAAMGKLFADAKDFDEIFSDRFPSVGVRFGLGELNRRFCKVDNSHEALSILASGVGNYLKAKGAKKPRRCADLLFALYLAREGVLFWPHISASEGSWILPQSLEPLFWSFALPTEWRAICAEVFKGDKQSSSILPFHRELLLRTNFFQIQEFNGWILPRIKEDIEIQRRQYTGVVKGRFSTHANRYFRLLVAAAGLDMEHPNVRGAVRYFGYGVKLGVDNSTEVYAWVYDPRRMRSEVGKPLLERDGKVPQYVMDWAQAMREGLTLLPTKTKYVRTHEMANWLFYVWEIGEENAPKTWQDISRNDHISGSGNSSFPTFVDFLKAKRAPETVPKTLRTFDQVMRLVAIREGWVDFVFPVDVAQDCPPKKGRVRAGRTHRKPLHEELLEVVIEENRRSTAGGLPFAFARGLPTQFRLITVPGSLERQEVFFPAAPIALDMILTTGMRSRSALWMDSGERDEFWIDREQLCRVPNPLATATPGFQDGYLRLVSLGPGEEAVGMYLAVNKTAPYEVPWVDEVNAGYFEMMRKWQIEHNPRRTPVVATHHRLEEDLSTPEEIGEVFTVFRDPRRPQGTPLTRSALYDYWFQLLQHCEPIYNERRRVKLAEIGAEFRWEPLVRPDGKPRWDLHSLRVTVVTTLIEAGVSPEVVAILVGHKSVVMTWHYNAVRNDVTHKEIRAGLEARREKALRALEVAQTDEEVDDVLRVYLGGADSVGKDGSGLLKTGITDGEPNPYEVFSHGICPGASCEIGLDDGSSRIKPVFRPQACSRCKFRVTGPAFLNGLVLRLNALMVEITNSFQVDQDLANEVARLEDAGRSGSRIEARLRRHRRFRDELWAEWAAELVTIRKSETAMLEEGGASSLITTGYTELSGKFDKVHALELLHEVVSAASSTSGGSMEIPAGTREIRDEILMEIARQNDAAEFFYRLDREKRRAAMEAFGDLITRHSRNRANVYPDFIEHLLNGEAKLPELRTVAARYSNDERHSHGEGRQVLKKRDAPDE